jgi:hypothetical protein
VIASRGTAPTLARGYTTVAGTTMVAIDFSAQVSLPVAEHFVIHNGSAGERTGSVWILEAPSS